MKKAISFVVAEGQNIQGSLPFLKADDNILFFLDKNRNLMVGDIDESFTLNKKQNITK